MIVETCSNPPVSSMTNNSRQKKYFPMQINKSMTKQNNHPSTNQNRTDDDYGGGGNENEYIEICS